MPSVASGNGSRRIQRKRGIPTRATSHRQGSSRLESLVTCQISIDGVGDFESAWASHDRKSFLDEEIHDGQASRQSLFSGRSSSLVIASGIS